MAVFHYVHLRAFAHETEDADRVVAAVKHAAHDDKLQVEQTRVDGSHGNRVLILDADVKSAPAAKRLFAALAADDPEGFAHIEATAAHRMDENLNFHLRLDKQAAYAGRLRLAQDDDAITLRAKVRSFESKRSGAGADAALQQLQSFLQGFHHRGTSVER